MKLRTSLTASRDGSLVDATDENLIHDAAAAHALMQALDDVTDKIFSKYARGLIDQRANELMAGWGFDSEEDA